MLFLRDLLSRPWHLTRDRVIRPSGSSSARIIKPLWLLFKWATSHISGCSRGPEAHPEKTRPGGLCLSLSQRLRAHVKKRNNWRYYNQLVDICQTRLVLFSVFNRPQIQAGSWSMCYWISRIGRLNEQVHSTLSLHTLDDSLCSLGLNAWFFRFWVWNIWPYMVTRLDSINVNHCWMPFLSTSTVFQER